MTDDPVNHVLELNSAMNQTLKSLADAVGLSPRDLETGADPAELKAEAEKAALFGATEAAAEKADDNRSLAQIAADLLEQNAANVARIAEAADVSKRDIALDPGASKLEEQKAAICASERDVSDTEKRQSDAETREDAHRFFFPNGTPDRHAGEGWRDADPDPGATDRSA